MKMTANIQHSIDYGKLENISAGVFFLFEISKHSAQVTLYVCMLKIKHKKRFNAGTPNESSNLPKEKRISSD